MLILLVIELNWWGMDWRVQVKVFKQENYLANFVQSTFAALPSEKVKGVVAFLVPDLTDVVPRSCNCLN